jgi:L-threonylcarbamoyladenylate synthase
LVSENKIRKVDRKNPRSEIIQEAAAIIQSGGVVIFPTTGLYGLGADADNPAAVERVFDIKQRPSYKPILILIPDIGCLKQIVLDVPESAQAIINVFWPGHITLIFNAGDALSELLTSGTGKIGIRLPIYPVARALVQAVGRPITATSANISAQPGCSRISDLDSSIVQAADLILDAGLLRGGSGSTVLDVTVNPPVMVREGAVSKKRITAALQKRSV